MIIENLQKTYPPFAADFAHLLLERRWYFMPGELNKIPVERIGVSFPVDQIALQSLGEIWVNDKLFAAMEFQDRELLIVHELVMGIRLMEFQSSYDKCIAAQGDLRIPILLGTATDEHQELWKKARRGCTIPGVDPNRPVGGLPTDPTKKLVLTKEDYLNIRSLVTKIWTSEGQLDPEEIKDWLNSRKFR